MLRNLLGGLLIAALAVTLLMTRRDWFLSDQHWAVTDVAAIPPGSGELRDDLDRIVSMFGVHVPQRPNKAEQIYQTLAAAGQAPRARMKDNYQPPRLGHAVRQWSFLGMPFGWHSELGFVLYSRDRWELVAAPLGEEGRAMLQREVGRDLTQGFLFPFWVHSWGWLYLAGVALWGWLYHRSVVRGREELGII